MSGPGSPDPIATSCRDSGAWTARPSPGPVADDPLAEIEGRWTLQILLCLNAGEHRFSDLRSAIPRVSANILTDRLRALESAGLVERRYLPPPHASHVYLLAKLAAELRPVLNALARWRSEDRKATRSARRSGRSSTPEREPSR